MDMQETVGKTMKHELIKLKQALYLAQRGYDLLELKRRALQASVREANKRVTMIRVATAAAITRAYDALEAAYDDIGTDNVERIRKNLHHPSNTVNSMGTDWMSRFPLAGMTASLDEAAITWRAAVNQFIVFIDAENELLALQLDLRKTSKRASALKNIRIPQNQARIKYIENKLEESERESIARLKRITNARLISGRP